MKTFAFTAALLGSTALAFPSMEAFKREVEKRNGACSTELIGDVATLPPHQLKPTGKAVKDILQGRGAAVDYASKYDYAPPDVSSDACYKDPCCVWKHIADELFAEMWDAAAGVCTDLARSAIRLGFHDAGAWDKAQSFGGADGSIILAAEEIERVENVPMKATAERMRTLHAKYTGLGAKISIADVIQTAAKVAAVSCPGGPRIRMFVGRKDGSAPNTPRLLPPPRGTGSDAASILALFANKSIGPGDVVALIGAHTASKSHANVTAGTPSQDSTPGAWDQKYFVETLQPEAPAGVTRFDSDINLAKDPVTAAFFKRFAHNKASWDKSYAAAYIRLSLLGVNNINDMLECTKVMPMPV